MSLDLSFEQGTEMMNVIRYSIVVLILAAVAAPVQAETTCNTLMVTLSGDLSLAIPPVFSEDGEMLDRNSQPEIEIPLELIRANNALVKLRFSRTAERVWVVDVMSTSQGLQPEKRSYTLAVIRLDFDEEGNQEIEQQLEVFPLFVSDSTAALVRVTIRDLKLINGASEISMLETSTTEESCPSLGEPDIYNEVNDGEETIAIDYPPGVGDDIMLSEQPE